MNILKIILFGLAMTLSLTASAQRYIIDHNLDDSASVYRIVTAENGSEVCGEEAFKLPLGETVTVERLLSGDDGSGLIRVDGVPYGIYDSVLMLSDDNPEDVVDIFGDTRSQLQHTWVGKWFGTFTPYMIIALLFVAAIVLAIGGLRLDSWRRAALWGLPACILAASMLEIWAYLVMGKSAFWWCDSDRYGFFGSMLRVVPFVVFVAFQLFSIKIYEAFLPGVNEDNKLSIKPLAIGIAICLPVALAIAMLLATFDIRGLTAGLASVAGLLICLTVGFVRSLVKNIKVLGKVNGLFFTVFGIVYAIGSLIALWGLVLVLLQIIVQVIIVIVCLGAGGKATEQINPVSPKSVNRYRGLDGKDYESDQARLYADNWWRSKMGRKL